MDQAVLPTSLVHDEDYPPGAKRTALADLADRLLAGEATAAGHAILRNDRAGFLAGRGPDGGEFVGDLDAIGDWVLHLDGSFVPIQGPPGTGKTFTAAHVIHGLVQAGQRVGVTAMSHHAIDNVWTPSSNASPGTATFSVRFARPRRVRSRASSTSMTTRGAPPAPTT